VSTILVTCGETSGDHHAALVVAALKRIDPSMRVVALGGSELEAAGAEIHFPMDRYAFMGFAEVLAGLPRVISLERRLKRLLRSVDLFMPVDYPGLNLRLAGAAREAGVPVLYFISPQVWAWGDWRMGKMKRIVDLMAVILPFEEALYRQAGIPAVFVGHPMLDEISAPQVPKEAPARDGTFDILIFPGSRRQEVARMLPPVLDAARIIRGRFPGARFILGRAPLILERDLVIPSDMTGYTAVTGSGIEELVTASLVLAASGTVTLQSAISGTPLVVFYRMSGLTYLLGKRLVRIPHIAMPNVLAGERLVPELIQERATPERIAAAASALIDDGTRYRELSRRLIGLRRALEGPGGALLVADIAVRMAHGQAASEIVAGLRRRGGQAPEARL
jgi:lipid-A-disaccharide synthase